MASAPDPFSELKKALAATLDEVLSSMEVQETDITFELPPDPKYGDLSCPACMGLARALKKNPRQIAGEVKAKLESSSGISLDSISKIEVAGPGYLNFFIDWKSFLPAVHAAINVAGATFGRLETGKGKKVIVEHTSANPNKPIHLGTARCAVLGDVTARLMRVAGHDVEVLNYIDDLGRQVAVLLHGYNNFKEEVPRDPSQKDDYYLGLVYVKGAGDIDGKETGEEIVREILHAMESPGTAENTAAKDLADMALKGQLITLWNMNIFFDLLVWERHIVSSGLFAEAIRLMQEKSPGSCYKVQEGEDEGCVVLDMSAFGDKYVQNMKPYKILQRSNGVSTYTGKDVAFQMWKFGEASGYLEFEPYVDQPDGCVLCTTRVAAKKGQGGNGTTSRGGAGCGGRQFGHGKRAINVIGFEQKYPQQVVASAMKVLGFNEHHSNSHHLSFKHVWLPDQKFSGRKGTWIGFHADAAMEKAVEKALEIVKAQNPGLSPLEQEELASSIGIGAIKFYLAKFDTEKEITIDWDDLLSFEGDACPYVQYSCVRAKSILEMARTRGIEVPEPGTPLDAGLLGLDEERALYFLLSKLPSLVEDWSSNLVVHQVPQYALDVADKFNKFYHSAPVLKEGVPRPLQVARLLLVQDCYKVLSFVMEVLLGIDIPPRM